MTYRLCKTALISVISMAMIAVLGGTPAEAAAAPAPREGVAVRSDGRLEVRVADPAGASGKVILSVVGGRLADLEVESEIDGKSVRDHFAVHKLLVTKDDNFRATLRSLKADRVMHLDSSRAVEQALPVLVAIAVLAILARIGIKQAIRWYGKRKVRLAAKSYLLKKIDANKWDHIMRPKHKWAEVGAKSKDEVAELMGRAMAEGKHVVQPGGKAVKVTWNYGRRVIEVTYAREGGMIGNGWVK